MRVGILGSGVIGTIYGWALSEKNEIVHIVRESKVKQLDGSKIKMDIIDERKQDGEQTVISEYHYHTIAQADDSFDFILVPVAEHQLEEALKELTKNASNTKYVIMASNWNGTQMIDRYLKPGQYLLGYAGGGGTIRMHDGQKELWGNIGADISLGTTNAEQKEFYEMVHATFCQVGIVPEVSSNILHWLWIHNIDSAALGVGLKLHGEISAFLEDKELVDTCFKAMQEGFHICEKRGVVLEEFPEVQMYAMPFDQIYPMFKGNFDQIYATGKDFEVSMPYMDRLYELL